MVEAGTKQPPELFSRRQILTGAAIGAGAILLPGIRQEMVDAGNNCRIVDRIDGLRESPNKVETLTNALYDRFNARAISTSDAYTLMGSSDTTEGSGDIFGFPSRDWGEPTLRLLYNGLSIFPEEMIKPAHGRDTNFALDHLALSGCQCVGVYNPDLLPGILRSPDVVMLDTFIFYPTDNPEVRNFPLRVLGHELIHRYDMDVTERATWSSVHEVFGQQDFSRIAETVRNRISTVDKDAMNESEAVAADRLNYGFAREHNNVSELVASSGEVFMFGKEYFTEGMSRFLGSSTTDELYEVLKEQIFAGKEYDFFPDICPK